MTTKILAVILALSCAISAHAHDWRANGPASGWTSTSTTTTSPGAAPYNGTRTRIATTWHNGSGAAQRIALAVFSQQNPQWSAGVDDEYYTQHPETTERIGSVIVSVYTFTVAAGGTVLTESVSEAGQWYDGDSYISDSSTMSTEIIRSEAAETWSWQSYSLYGAWSEWSPDPSTVVAGQSYTQARARSIEDRKKEVSSLGAERNDQHVGWRTESESRPATGTMETWTPFDEPGAWTYGEWSPDPSTVDAGQNYTQSRTASRWHRTGERSNLNNERNVGGYTESSSETRPAVGTRNRAPTIAWADVPASLTYGETHYARATGADADGNLTRVVVQRQVNGGAWTAYEDETVSARAAYTNTGGNYTITDAGNSTIEYRAAAYDAAGASSTWITWGPATVAKANQAALTLTPTTNQTYNTSRTFTVGGGSGTGAYSDALSSGAATRTAAWTYRADSGTGNYVVSVTRAADSNYNAITSTFSVPMVSAAQTITFPAIGTKTEGDAPFTISATSTSALPVTFSVLSGPATVSGSTVTITGAGTVVIRASQAGNTNWAAATNVDQTFTVNPGQPVLFANIVQLDMGNARVNGGDVSARTTAVTFRITNTGYQTLTLSGISFGNTDYTVIGHDGGAVDYPRYLPAGVGINITVMFRPSKIGSRNTTMTIANNTVANPNAIYTVLGTGRDPDLRITWGPLRLIP